MSTHDQRLLEMLPAYALGALDTEEREELERHLDAGCAVCEAEMSDWSRVLDAMGDDAPAVEPSELTWKRLERAIADAEPKAPPVTAVPAPSWAGRLAAALAVVALGWSLWSQAGLREEITALAAERDRAAVDLAGLESELGTMRGELAAARAESRIVAAPRVATVGLDGLGSGEGSSARCYVDTVGRRAVFYASNLPALAAERTYQLWFIADGVPVSAGVFAADDQGAAAVLVDDVADESSIQAWAVTVEPAGGVPQPTGEMILKG